MIDPWIEGNPSCPEQLREVGHVDIIAITHGHFDHIGSVIPLCKKYNPRWWQTGKSATGWTQKEFKNACRATREAT